MPITSEYSRGVFAYLGGRDCLVFRIAGPGLGNMLFPWARALLFARQTGIPLFSPTWPQLKIGPLLRREDDLRGYSFQFTPRAGEISGVRRAAWLSICEQIDEQDEVRQRGFRGAGIIHTFEGLADYFASLGNSGEFLREVLCQATERDLHPDPGNAPTVAIHIRYGDFRSMAPDSEKNIARDGIPLLHRVPIPLLLDMIDDVRMALGERTPIRVYSDGTDQELAPVLNTVGVERSPANSAITDLLEMSSAKLLVGTPHSTFSMWAAFLGKAVFLGFPEGGGRSYGYEPASTTLLREDRRAFIQRNVAERFPG